MRDYSQNITNQYGIDVSMPPLMGTKKEKIISNILDDLGIVYKAGFYFDEYKSSKYDFAILKENGNVGFLLEYDGDSHYNPDFYKSMGNREVRNKAHIVINQFASANKARIAVENQIPLLRIDKLYIDYGTIRDTLVDWIWKFVDGFDVINQEISLVMMFDKYGWSFNYVQQSDASKPTLDFLKKRQDFININGNLNKENWEKFYNKDLLSSLLKNSKRSF